MLHAGRMSRTNKTLKSLLYKYIYIYILFIYNEKVHIINTGKGGWGHCQVHPLPTLLRGAGSLGQPVQTELCLESLQLGQADVAAATHDHHQ